MGSVETSLLVWGLFVRLLGAVYLIFFASALPQCAGLNRIYPIDALLRRARRDMPLLAAIMRFPTLCWLSPTTRSIQIQLSIGAGAAVLVILGLPGSPLFLLLCWIMAVSAVNAMGEFVIFTWDLLLLEMGFLALFLPGLAALPSLAISETPFPLLAFAYKFLLARMILGMGKLKFWGRWWHQIDFIGNFLSFQPLPARAAWFLQKLPKISLRLALILMFVVEMIFPFFLFGPDWMRVVAALSIIGLQFGIWLGGNFGIFNVLTIVLCVPMFEGASSLWATSFSLAAPGELAVNIVLLFVMLGGVLYFRWDAWRNNYWLYGSVVYASPWRYLRPLLALYRWLHPFHIANGYGVFDVNEENEHVPTLQHRLVVVIEGSRDGDRWKEYVYKYHTCEIDRPPPYFAPHQPRIDHNLYYEAWYLRLSSINGYNPYYWNTWTWLDRVVQRLLEGDRDVLALFGRNPFPDAPPNYIRIKRYAYRFSTAEERRSSGHWYVREFDQMHLEPVILNPEVFRLPEPDELWPELSWWQEYHGFSTATALVKETRNREMVDMMWEARLTSRQRQNISGRHLVKTDQRWIDATFEPTMPTLMIRYGSRAWSNLLKTAPELSTALKFDRQITLVWQRQAAIAVGPSGEKNLTVEQLKSWLSDPIGQSPAVG